MNLDNGVIMAIPVKARLSDKLISPATICMRLKDYANGAYTDHVGHALPALRGQAELARYIAHYLEQSLDARYNLRDGVSYLPQIVVDAVNDMRTSMDAEAVVARHHYARAMDFRWGMPHPTRLGEGNLAVQSSLQRALGGIFDAVLHPMAESTVKPIRVDMRDYVWSDIFLAYASAEATVLQLRLDEFLARVYRKGLYDLIQKNGGYGSGVFGSVKLLTAATAGRLLITFRERESDGKKLKPVDYAQLRQITLIAEDDDPLALSAGIQSVQGNLASSLWLVDDVINHWPASVKDQIKCYKRDRKVSVA